MAKSAALSTDAKKWARPKAISTHNWACFRLRHQYQSWCFRFRSASGSEVGMIPSEMAECRPSGADSRPFPVRAPHRPGASQPKHQLCGRPHIMRRGVVATSLGYGSSRGHQDRLCRPSSSPSSSAHILRWGIKGAEIDLDGARCRVAGAETMFGDRQRALQVGAGPGVVALGPEQ